MAKFQKGQSGNPTGRPKGVLYLTPALRTKLGEKVPGDPAGRTHRDVILDRLLTMAGGGDLEAIKIILDRTDGKVAQPVEHAGEGGGALAIVVTYRDEAIGSQ